MTSQSETGHAKNIQAFKTILSYCQGYGAAYNPPTTVLELANLQTHLTNAQNALVDSIKKQTILTNTTNQRQLAYQNLQALATKIINALTISGVSQNTLDSAKTITRKIQGQRATPIAEPADPNQPQANTSSVSQLSYSNQAQHLSTLIELLSTLPEYKPNETELQLASLQTYHTTLQTSNTNVTEAQTNWSNSRIDRNNQLYAPGTGLLATAKNIKAYIKSLYGPSSPQYKQLSTLQFSKP